MRSSLVPTSVLASTLTACALFSSPQELTTGNLKSEGYVPAVATALTPEDQIAIKQAIGRLAGKGLTKLPDSAFKESSILLLSHNIAPSKEHPNGIPIEHLPPYKFELFTNGGQCVLAYCNTSATAPLENTECQAKR